MNRRGFFIFEKKSGMKFFFCLGFILFGSLGFGQFKVEGNINGYSNKPIMIRINSGSTEKLINRVETDKNGHFSVNIPQKYSGILILTNIQKTSSVEILTDNEDVEFNSDNINGNLFSNINFSKGKNAIGFQKYINYQNLNDIKQNLFPIMKELYKNSDDFFQAMVKEEDRISKLNPSTELPLIKYYAQLNELANSKVETKVAGEVYNNKILSRLTNDNEFLEGSGFLSKLVLDYFRYSIIDAKSQEDINSIVERDIETLLKATDIETPRGQNVLTSIFSVLPKDQFSKILEKYYSKANALTCEKTDELKTSLSSHNISTPGTVVPNIIFKEPIKGYNSLYDIKTDKKIIIFWASWCPACRDEMPFVKEYYDNFKKSGGEIVAVSLDFDLSEFQKATKDFGWINYTDLAQWDSQGVDSYGISSTPTLFLVDKDNKLIKAGNHISELIEVTK